MDRPYRTKRQGDIGENIASQKWESWGYTVYWPPTPNYPDIDFLVEQYIPRRGCPELAFIQVKTNTDPPSGKSLVLKNPEHYDRGGHYVEMGYPVLPLIFHYIKYPKSFVIFDYPGDERGGGYY